MDAGAVGKGDQQLAVHGFDKVQQAQPLILLQHILEALGNHTRLVLTIKIIVGLVGPGAGNTDPDRTEGPGQVDQTLILGIDGGVPLLELHHVCQVHQRRNGLGAGDLAGGVGLPEGTAGDFRHFHIVGHETFIHNANCLDSAGLSLIEENKSRNSHSEMPYSLPFRSGCGATVPLQPYPHSRQVPAHAKLPVP